MDSGLAGASDEPTVASVLGVKSQLRFHPHGSTQKAHVVLRQVELSEESDDEGDSSMVYFSLFAQKRIEVKPGKEILLAVATPDGKFLETPVVFAGKVSGEDDLIHNASPQPFRVDLPTKSRPPVIPPKLRKPWHEAPITEPATHANVHVQPSYVSIAVQATPTADINPEVDSKQTTSNTSIPEAPPKLASQDLLNKSVQPPSSEVSVEEQLEESSDRGRSLSPMDLDSRSSSPAYSPPPAIQYAATDHDGLKSTSFSPPGLSVPIPSHQQLSQLETSPLLQTESRLRPPSSSPESDDPPGLSLPPLLAEFVSPSKVGKTDTVATPAKEQLKSPVLSSRPTEHQLPTSTKPENLRVSTNITTTQSATNMGQSSGGSTTAATPYVPKRKTVPNPFVSGGLLTDFVGNIPPGKTTPQPTPPISSKAETTTTQIPSMASATRSSPVPTASPRSSPDGSSSIRSSPRSPQTSRTVLSPPSSPASSSKVKIEDVPPLSSVVQPVSPPGTSLAQFGIRPQHSSPPRAMPTGPRMSRFSHAPPANTPTVDPGHPVDNGITVPIQPPPDYKQLAYVAEVSYSNPLGIKPAGTNGWRSNKPLPPQLSTSAPSKANGPKKPVAIGSGWPYNRQMNGNAPRGPAARRTSFQNGPIVSPPGSVPPMEHMYSNSSLPTPSGASPGDSRFDSHPVAANGTSDNSPNGSVYGSWNGQGPDASSLLNRLSSPQTDVVSTEATIAAAPSPISSSDPGDSPTSASNNLPMKPPAYSGPTPSWSPRRGVKRMGSPPPPTQDPRRQRTFKWPISNGVHSAKLKGAADGDDIGVRTIVHSSDGSLFAVTCCDKSVRIWSNKTRTEVAKLAHNMQIIDVAWMDRDAGVVTLGENGIVSTWTRSAANKWQWAKILDASGDRRGEDNPCCLAFCRDRLAIAYPRSGVKIWLFVKGTWSPQRSIVRQNVTTIKFVEDGEGLVGGTTDGVLWHCQVPNGTLRAYAFMRTKISMLDIDPKGTHALAAQTAGCILVNIGDGDGKGNVEQAYTINDSDLQSSALYGFGALFATRGMSLLFGTTQGCIMVWDRASGDVVHGLYLGEEHSVQAVASFDGSQAFDGYILTGTRQGQLTWFSQPPVNGAANRNGAR